MSEKPTTRNPWIVVPSIGVDGSPVAGSNWPMTQIPLTRTALPSELVQGLSIGFLRGLRMVP